MIRQRRIQLRLTQELIAEALRITPEAVGNWERGVRRIELSKTPRLAKLLSLHVPDFCRYVLREYHPALAVALFDEPAAEQQAD